MGVVGVKRAVRAQSPVMFHIRLALALVVATTASSCATDSPPGGPTRETLPNGAVLVRYPDLPAIDSVGPEVTDVQADLKFGSRDGLDPNFIFGDLRGIQVASDGTIYVLDNQGEPSGQRKYTMHDIMQCLHYIMDT